MEARTHLDADPRLCGRPLDLAEGRAQVALDTIDSMVVDRQGLVHGGFVFGLADYAAMLAVNDPNVVLGAAATRFLKPVRQGDQVIATAEVIEANGKKREVLVAERVGNRWVFEGTFTCFVLEHHVLEGVGSK